MSYINIITILLTLCLPYVLSQHYEGMEYLNGGEYLQWVVDARVAKNVKYEMNSTNEHFSAGIFKEDDANKFKNYMPLGARDCSLHDVRFISYSNCVYDDSLAYYLLVHSADSSQNIKVTYNITIVDYAKTSSETNVSASLVLLLLLLVL